MRKRRWRRFKAFARRWSKLTTYSASTRPSWTSSAAKESATKVNSPIWRKVPPIQNWRQLNSRFFFYLAFPFKHNHHHRNIVRPDTQDRIQAQNTQREMRTRTICRCAYYESNRMKSTRLSTLFFAQICIPKTSLCINTIGKKKWNLFRVLAWMPNFLFFFPFLFFLIWLHVVVVVVSICLCWSYFPLKIRLYDVCTTIVYIINRS